MATEEKHDPDSPEAGRSNSVLIRGAKSATDKEHGMSLVQGVKLYPKAIGWSILISTCIAMEGFDVCLLPNFYNFPKFKEKYGHQLPNGTWEIPAPWQAGLQNGSQVGQIIGLFINGYVSEWIGYRWTVLTCLTLVAGFTAILFTAQSVEILLVGYILSGIPWGVFQTLTITYASEVCPVALRGYLTTYVNFVSHSPLRLSWTLLHSRRLSRCLKHHRESNPLFDECH